MLTAYILIRADSGTEREVVEELLDLEEVEEAETIYGEWDLVVKLKLDDISRLGDFVLSRIRVIRGIKQTSTLIVAG